MYEDAAARWPSAASLRAAEAAPIDISALRSVLAEGAYPNCSDAFGHTPLFLALLHDSADAIALLLAAQADVTESFGAERRVLVLLFFVTKKYLTREVWGLPECVQSPSPKNI